MIYVPYDFQYNCGKNKRKNDSCFSIVLCLALISRRSRCKWKKCVIFFWNSPSFHYFVCPSAPAFVSPTASEVFFGGQRASLYLSVSAFRSFFSVSLSFSLFKIWSLTFVFVHTKREYPGSFFLQVCLQGGGWTKVISGWATYALALWSWTSAQDQHTSYI